MPSVRSAERRTVNCVAHKLTGVQLSKYSRQCEGLCADGRIKRSAERMIRAQRLSPHTPRDRGLALAAQTTPVIAERAAATLFKLRLAWIG